MQNSTVPTELCVDPVLGREQEAGLTKRETLPAGLDALLPVGGMFIKVRSLDVRRGGYPFVGVLLGSDRQELAEIRFANETIAPAQIQSLMLSIMRSMHTQSTFIESVVAGEPIEDARPAERE